MLPQRSTKNCWQPPEAGRGKEDPSPGSKEKYSPTDTLTSGFKPQQLLQNKSLLFMPPVYGNMLQQPVETNTDNKFRRPYIQTEEKDN